MTTPSSLDGKLDRVVRRHAELGDALAKPDANPAAFGKPVRMVNDAAMQALGCYKGGRMLFLGLGTGLGSALVIDGVLAPLELAHLPYKRGRSYEDLAGMLDITSTRVDR